MNKKILAIFTLFLFISCSGVAPMSKHHIKEISNIASMKIFEEAFERVGYKDMRIYKRGFGKWFVSAYGDKGIYMLEIDEDGKILKYQKNNYTE
ncbi:hypothetical protein [Streptobacillus moniliformis]|uniref:hypothetical protein n=1 Tax=Streptobacillus moniliformis TaxID=34105 RepID=UPI0007E32448|nr:hypothetical protein [Streptobacillus moniliformis]